MSLSLQLSRSLATAALILLAGHSAQAASTSAKAANSRASAKAASGSLADGIETVSVDTADSGTPSQSATTSIENNALNPISTSTEGLAKKIQESSPRRVFGEFYTETNEATTDIEAGKGTPKFNSYAGVKYDLGNARAFSVRQGFSYDSAGGGGTDTRSLGGLHINDTMLNYTDGKLASILGDGSVILIGRVYLPTGETSRFVTHQQGKERLYLIETKSFGKVDLTLVQLGKAFNWTQDQYFAGGKTKSSPTAALTGEFDAFYNFTPVVSVGAIAGYDHGWFRPGGYDTQTADVYIQPTVQVIPSKGVTAQVYLYNQVEIRNPTNKFAFMRDDGGDNDELSVWANLSLAL